MINVPLLERLFGDHKKGTLITQKDIEQMQIGRDVYHDQTLSGAGTSESPLSVTLKVEWR